MSSSLITFSKITPGNRAGAVDLVGYRLPFPKNLSVSSQFDWESPELGMIGQMISGLSGVDDFSVGALGSRVYREAESGLAEAAGGIGQGVQRRRNVSKNPKEEVLFKGVSHREFPLEWDLAPLTESDVLSTMEFLKEIYRHASPTIAPSGAYFNYPDTVNVKVEDEGGITLNRNECAITEIDTNLTPDGVWASFKNGLPVHVTVTVQFKELVLPHKDNVVFE